MGKNEKVVENKKLKVALCYTGLATSFENVVENNIEKIIKPNSCDVFVSTADVFVERGPFNSSLSKTITPKSRRYTYLKRPEHGWRKNYGSAYGTIYNINEEQLANTLNEKLGAWMRAYYIESQNAEILSSSYENTKWQWLRKNQLRKIRKAWDLLLSYEKENNIKYDVIVNMRMDVFLKPKIVLADYKLLPKNCVHAFGGWINSEYMDKGIFDGFLYGDRKSMSVYYGMYDELQKPYKNQKYASWFKKYGAAFENQLVTHLNENGIDIKFMNKQRKITKKHAKWVCYTIMRARQNENERRR